MADVAVFCNNYPNIEVSFNITDADDVTAGNPVQITVKLERELDEDEDVNLTELGKVSAPLFPKDKKESWWVVIGDAKRNSLLSLKRVSLQQVQNIKLEFMAPEEAGDYELTLYCMSDSYLGCDQEYSVDLNVAVADDSSDESSDEE